MKRILVSGSSGFIGKNLLKYLENNIELEIYTIQKSDILKDKEKNIISYKLPNEEAEINKLILGIKPDILIHLAWKGIPDYNLENSIYSVNNTISLAKACLLAGTKKIIVTGSCWEYLNPIGQVSENWPLDNSNFFKASKNYCHNILKILCQEYGANLTWLRLFYVYGKYQHSNSLLPSLIKQAQSGKEPIPKNPYSSLDFINAKDVSQIIYKAIFLDNFTGTFNLGSGKTTLTGEIANEVRSKFGYKKISLDKKKEIKPNFYADLEKLNNIIQFKPQDLIEDISNLI